MFEPFFASLAADCLRNATQAKHILIAGGGPVGVEIAAEILHLYPQKVIASLRLLRLAMPVVWCAGVRR